MLATLQTGYRFGPFRVFPEQRQLVADGKPVAIQGRAFDLLTFLVRNRERVVSREEIFAAVWAGTTVSDNNLTVQISALRRTLCAHGGDPAVIANLAGRGYRFVGTVTETTTMPEAGSDQAAELFETSALIERLGKPGSKVPTGRFARQAVPLAGLVALLTISTALVIATAHLWPGTPKMQPQKLEIAVENLSTTGSEHLQKIASRYTDAIFAHPLDFSDIELFRIKNCDGSVRYCLSGSVNMTSQEISLTVSLTLEHSRQNIYENSWTLRDDATDEQVFIDVRNVFGDFRPFLFAKEKEMQSQGRATALDLYVQAQVETRGVDTPAGLDKGINLLKKALGIDAAHKPSKLLMSSLLLGRMSISPEGFGNVDGDKALDLVKSILNSETSNATALANKALALVQLNRPKEAIRPALDSLVKNPRGAAALTTLMEAYIESESYGDASHWLSSYSDLDDGSLSAQFYFANRNYDLAIAGVRRFQQGQSVDIQTNLMELLAVAAEWLSGDKNTARTAFAAVKPNLPSGFAHTKDLRKTYYDLSDVAWISFVDALRGAGMPA